MSDLDATPDSRLALAIDLLRSVVGAGDAPAGGPAAGGFAPLVAQPELDRRLSATDLISFWFQPAATAFDPWDEFFSAPAPNGRNGVAAPDAAEGALTDLRAMVADPEGDSWAASTAGRSTHPSSPSRRSSRIRAASPSWPRSRSTGTARMTTTPGDRSSSAASPSSSGCPTASG